MIPQSGQFLNVTAMKTTQQPTKDNCVLDCIDTDDCWSINAIEQPNGSSFQCQLLSTDKHRNSANYVALTGSTHFAIPVSLFSSFTWFCLLRCLSAKNGRNDCNEKMKRKDEKKRFMNTTYKISSYYIGPWHHKN